MAKSLFKVGVGIAKSVNREIAKSKRESAKRQRQLEMYDREERRIISERAKIKKTLDRLELEKAKYLLQAEIDDAKKAYMNRCEERKLRLQQELHKANRLTALRILTSPVDGVVEELVVATIGGIVTPAQELLHIVPTTSNDANNKEGNKGLQLDIEAGLLNKDIGFVHTGQIAEIKIDSFPFTKYGVIDGTVTDISADAIEHEQLGLLFPLKASIKTDEINVDGKWVKLKPGMSVTIEIKTGTRRLMEFLLAPLMRGVSEGARER